MLTGEGRIMRTHFAEVLAREGAALAQVTDGSELARWRGRVIRELMNPQSPYSLALRQTVDLPDRADFLGRWRALIAEMVDRLRRPRGMGVADCSPACASAESGSPDADAHQAAVLILAALHGGCTLSQVAGDPWPLNAALDLALAPLLGPGGADRDGDG